MLLAAYSPRLVEFLDTGDIPLDPNYAWIANAYGLIPVNRGNLDREALSKCLDVLAQDGTLGIFPEGGIWNLAHMQAQIGVAMLSLKAQAPVIPIGFGGMRAALATAMKLKRPRLVMNVGKIMPPAKLVEGEGIKEGLQRSANQILSAIDVLLPEEEIKRRQNRQDESYTLELQVMDGAQPIQNPDHLQLSHTAALARLMFTPVLMDALVPHAGHLCAISSCPSNRSKIKTRCRTYKYINRHSDPPWITCSPTRVSLPIVLAWRKDF